MAADVEEICPSVDVLTNIETAVPCPVRGCSKTFCNTASLRMHVVKTHNITENEEEKGIFTRNSEKKKSITKHFYCPVSGCSRGKSSKKPFPRLGQLKQHYMTVHAEKQHTCTKCSRGFGLLAACKRHESKCGQVFHCGCGCPFTTREALLMHINRKKHSLPTEEKVPGTPAVQSNRIAARNIYPVFQQGNQPTTILIATAVTGKHGMKEKSPISLQRYCKILPKPAVNLSKCQHPSTMQKPISGLSGCSGVSNTKNDAGTQTSRQKSLKNSSTQTAIDISTCVNGDMSNAGNCINYASVGTQANKTLLNPVATMIDFGSQVMVPDMTHSSSVGTQHDNLLFMNHSNLGIQADPACFSLSSQTLLTGNDLQITDPRFLSSSETQTQDFSQVVVEDNAAQTSISIFDFDPSLSTDCGTQTQTQMIFDEFLSQSDVELTESQTQTWLSSLMPSVTEMSNSSNELNTQTTLEDLVNIQTQTPGMANDMHVPFDVGLTNTETQTIPEAFANNSWTYEQINTQTQMTQTAAGVIYNQLMDTYTQTLLDDIDNVFSSVQTQT